MKDKMKWENTIMDEEKQVERFRLHKAFLEYKENQTQEGYEAFLQELFACAQENRHAMVPADMDSGQMTYGLYRGRNGWYYEICTSPEELDKCPERVTLIVLLATMIKRAAADEGIKGLCINPGDENRVYIPRDNLA